MKNWVISKRDNLIIDWLNNEINDLDLVYERLYWITQNVKENIILAISCMQYQDQQDIQEIKSNYIIH